MMEEYNNCRYYSQPIDCNSHNDVRSKYCVFEDVESVCPNNNFIIELSII